MIHENELSITAISAVTVHGGVKELVSAYESQKFAVQGECDVAGLGKYVSKKNTRRMCKLTAMALLSAYECLADDTYTSVPLSANAGILLATGYGPASASFNYLDSIIDYGFEMPSPLYFSTSVQNMAAASIALSLGLSVPVQTICQYESSVHAALKTACLWLNAGIADEILLIGVDELVFPLEVSANIISETHMRHSRNMTRLSEGAFCMRLKCHSEKRYGRAVFFEESMPQPLKSFRSGAYRAELADAQDNSRIYGNIPVAYGLDILIALGCVGKYAGVVRCTTADSWGNSGSVIISK